MSFPTSLCHLTAVSNISWIGRDLCHYGFSYLELHGSALTLHYSFVLEFCKLGFKYVNQWHFVPIECAPAVSVMTCTSQVILCCKASELFLNYLPDITHVSIPIMYHIILIYMSSRKHHCALIFFRLVIKILDFMVVPRCIAFTQTPISSFTLFLSFFVCFLFDWT